MATEKICERCGRPSKRRTKCPNCGRLLDSWCYHTHQLMIVDHWPCQWEETYYERQQNQSQNTKGKER
jgi:hypothetical protein